MSKLLSARYMISLFLGLTFCIGFINGLIPSEAFVTAFGFIIQSYFNRVDRRTKDGNV